MSRRGRWYLAALALAGELDYAVTGGLVLVSTGADAIASAVRQGKSLAQDAGYHAAISGVPSQVTSLLFSTSASSFTSASRRD